ncbi:MULTISPECIES: TetR/AcrR family transcriptional regulator [unclassified Aureispira]|uniref:TetR/AcrR family transcriptional regulator n=1 Tax=unclassified Aureispira TaxID=2649989 RepID=UPI000695B09E|nr:MULTISPECIES: TetR/AcrR family transcriptional regulator [unclassified Aureispira]WMX15990.1 TetR/AcrR family transcriptional regulator [Aureispira sp. CCB-E]
MGYKYNKEDIIALGSELIRKSGYHNVGINEILKTCAIPKGSFYNFFSSKEDFVEQSIKLYGFKSVELIRSFLNSKEPSPIQRLRNFYEYILDINHKEGCNAGCLINNLSIELAGINTHIGKIIDQHFQEVVEEIALCVKEGQDLGEITTKFSASYIAEYIHAGIGGAFSRMKAQNNRTYLDKWYQMTFEFIAAKAHA